MAAEVKANCSETLLIAARLRSMPGPEEYRQRSKEARNQAKACCHDWERQGLLNIADQYDRLAAYKNLTASSSSVTAPAQETAILLPQAPKLGDDISPNKQDAPIFLDAKVRSFD
jgi:hypothetical protein